MRWGKLSVDRLGALVLSLSFIFYPLPSFSMLPNPFLLPSTQLPIAQPPYKLITLSPYQPITLSTCQPGNQNIPLQHETKKPP